MSQENTFREDTLNNIGEGLGLKRPEFQGREYQNHTSKGGTSSILSYQIFINRIVVHFANRQNKRFTYTYERKVVGGSVFFDMKDLARQGWGLNSFIMQNKIPWSKKE